MEPIENSDHLLPRENFGSLGFGGGWFVVNGKSPANFPFPNLPRCRFITAAGWCSKFWEALFRRGMVRGEWEVSGEFPLSESSPPPFHHGGRVV
jgi:hypothetical protein